MKHYRIVKKTSTDHEWKEYIRFYIQQRVLWFFWKYVDEPTWPGLEISFSTEQEAIETIFKLKNMKRTKNVVCPQPRGFESW